MDIKDKKILVTGASGMVGKSLVNRLIEENCRNLLLPSSKELDFRNGLEVENYFKDYKPEYVFHLAAKDQSGLGYDRTGILCA